MNLHTCLFSAQINFSNVNHCNLKVTHHIKLKTSVTHLFDCTEVMKGRDEPIMLKILLLFFQEFFQKVSHYSFFYSYT